MGNGPSLPFSKHPPRYQRQSPAMDLSAGKDDLADSNYNPSAAICFDFGAKTFPGEYLRKREGRSVPLPRRGKVQNPDRNKAEERTLQRGFNCHRDLTPENTFSCAGKVSRGSTLTWETSWGHRTALGGFGGRGQFCTEG